LAGINHRSGVPAERRIFHPAENYPAFCRKPPRSVFLRQSRLENFSRNFTVTSAWSRSIWLMRGNDFEIQLRQMVGQASRLSPSREFINFAAG
jgi:hypothetical protein